MLRRIIRIDEEKCNGCGACAAACHEGAIDIVNGKARLLREDYCDGLGDCLPQCPVDAISFEEREAPAYDEEAVQRAKAAKAAVQVPCPGEEETPSALCNWPVQIKLAPLTSPAYADADLLIAADCTAFAYADFHRRLLPGKVALVGCTKLDQGDYSEKLRKIFEGNAIRSVTVARMTVPCCGGMVQAVKRALLQSGRDIPCSVVTITTDGHIKK